MSRPEDLIKTKENGHYSDTVRATYQDVVMMGLGINNIEKIVRTVLTNYTSMGTEKKKFPIKLFHQ